MDDFSLRKRIADVFGRYERPSALPGEAEPWKDHVCTLDLEYLAEADLYDLVFHINAPHELGVGVLKYALRRCLPIVLDNPETPDSSGTVPWTVERCCDWRLDFEDEEHELLGDIWLFLWQCSVAKGCLSPFFFNLLCIWNTAVPAFDSGDWPLDRFHDPDGMEKFIVMLKTVIRPYLRRENYSPFSALCGKYEEIDRRRAKHGGEGGELILQWREEAFDAPVGPYRPVVPAHELAILDAELAEKFGQDQ